MTFYCQCGLGQGRQKLKKINDCNEATYVVFNDGGWHVPNTIYGPRLGLSCVKYFMVLPPAASISPIHIKVNKISFRIIM